jgi:predicted nucleic acid-binding Zn ribbon protein
MEQNQLRVNLLECPNVTCEKCESPFFKKVTVIKKISKFMVGTSEDQYQPMETYVCNSCGHINAEYDILNPKE